MLPGNHIFRSRSRQIRSWNGFGKFLADADTSNRRSQHNCCKGCPDCRNDVDGRLGLDSGRNGQKWGPIREQAGANAQPDINLSDQLTGRGIGASIGRRTRSRAAALRSLRKAHGRRSRCMHHVCKPKKLQPAYSGGPDFPADRFANGSIAASVSKAAFTRSTSVSDISSRLMNELRAAAFTRISSSSFSCMACVSRV
jgi:hypothetical protein